MKKTSDRKAFKRKLQSRKLTVIVIIRFVMILLAGYPLLVSAGGGNALRDGGYRVKGKVVDRKGEPLPGVTIRLDSTTVGSVTGQDGTFVLLLPEREGVLVFSFIGYETARVRYNGETAPLLVMLKEKVAALDEVTVVAYGTQNKREVVGAMSTVKGEDLEDIPSPSLANLLQGRVAGMNVPNTTGAPGGGGVSVIIRGFNSLSIESSRRGSEPLWVIDGVPMLSFTSPVTGTNTLAEIDPNDIESVQVLKDAASAAIYGSRAANGVILVTTKKGRLNQRAKVSVNVSRTFIFDPALPDITGGHRERLHRLEALRDYQQAAYNGETNTYEYVAGYKDSYLNRLQYDYFWNMGDGANVAPYQDSLNKFYNNSTNLFDYYFRTARVTDASLQLSGGNAGITYNVGIGYYDESGVLRNTGFGRVKILGNFCMMPFPKLETNMRFYLARAERKRSSREINRYGFTSGTELEQVPEELLNTSTVLPGPGNAAFDELVKRFETIKEKNESYRLRVAFDVSYEFVKGLTFKSSLSADYSQQNQQLFMPSEVDEYKETYSSGQISRNLMLLNENLLTYKHTFAEAHTVDVLAGLSFQTDEMYLNSGWGRGAPSNLIHYVSWEGNVYDTKDNRSLKDFTSDKEKSTMVGVFGRVNYNYLQKYLVSITLRRDASSKFGEKVRWGTFPSYAIGYAFSEESFMAWAKRVLDYGKIRVSFGKSGRQFDQPYVAYGVLGASKPFLGNPTVEPELGFGLINRELTWEETRQWDVGMDMDLLNYRLGVVVDYYRRYTDKLLYPVRLPGTHNGYSAQWQNAYGILNEGVEVMVKWDITQEREVKWDMTFNIARNWNRLKKSQDGKDFSSNAGLNNMNVIGKPLNGIYAFRTAGYYNSMDEVPCYYIDGKYTPLRTLKTQFYRPGDRVIVDADGNGRIEANSTEEDREYVGAPLPLASGGITTSLEWMGFDLNMLFNYVLGRHILNAGRGASVGTVAGMIVEDITKPVFEDLGKVTFWQKPGDRTDYPKNRLEAGLYNFSTNIYANVQNVSFIKLKTITLGYSLPEAVRKKLHFGARVFVSAENLFTITNYKGADPESVDVVTGVDNLGNYPLARRVTIGLTINL